MNIYAKLHNLAINQYYITYMDLVEMGKLIKRRRESLGLRQEDLAELSKVANKTIHFMEQGTGNPSFETLKKVADVLGLELALKIKSVS